MRRVVRRLQALAVAFRGRWRRSLQLRMVTYTVVASSILVALFGVLVVTRTTQGLLHAQLVSAKEQIRNGHNTAKTSLDQLGQHDESTALLTMSTIVNTLSQGDAGGPVPVVLLFPPSTSGVPVARSSTLPPSVLIQPVQGVTPLVTSNHQAHQYVTCQVDKTGSQPCLAIGLPVKSSRAGVFQLYYLFPLDAEQTAVSVTRNTVIIIGVALVVMLALMAWLVTQMVVRPVRLAARTAQRLSAGLLDQRMEVHGEDDLALLGAAFNQMAVNLQRQIVRLEDMSRLQRRFTSDVSHELRTPLTTVRMAADLLYGSREELDPVMARSAELLHAELDRFDELMTDLLEISRFDAGFAVLDAEPTDLVPAVHRVARGLSAVADSVGVRIEVHVPETPVIAEVDPRRAERVLRNLVGNAIEHGEGQPVVVTLAVDDRAVAVTVRDHGIGLKPGEEKLVFNRFWRADPSRARQTGGTGLGLSISLEDARLHGGWLEAWGAPGQGAQFRLTLPVRAGSKLTSAPLPLVPADADVVPTGHPHTIVGDDQTSGRYELTATDDASYGDVAGVVAEGAIEAGTAIDDDVTIYAIEKSGYPGSVPDGQRPLDDDRPAPAGATDRSGPPRRTHE
ncbi:MAG TPA: MtrAB system histidine kinase MtrB [Micromonosporaceae bacterium]|nr:MtrAB system histidine kinase MtrB [Micromonosporaceae bacterium]